MSDKETYSVPVECREKSKEISWQLIQTVQNFYNEDDYSEEDMISIFVALGSVAGLLLGDQDTLTRNKLMGALVSFARQGALAVDFLESGPQGTA